MGRILTLKEKLTTIPPQFLQLVEDRHGGVLVLDWSHKGCPKRGRVSKVYLLSVYRSIFCKMRKATKAEELQYKLLTDLSKMMDDLQKMTEDQTYKLKRECWYTDGDYMAASFAYELYLHYNYVAEMVGETNIFKIE